MSADRLFSFVYLLDRTACSVCAWLSLHPPAAVVPAPPEWWLGATPPFFCRLESFPLVGRSGRVAGRHTDVLFFFRAAFLQVDFRGTVRPIRVLVFFFPAAGCAFPPRTLDCEEVPARFLADGFAATVSFRRAPCCVGAQMSCLLLFFSRGA